MDTLYGVDCGDPDCGFCYGSAVERRESAVTPDLFNYVPDRQYPRGPGWKDPDTSKQAADHVASRVELLRGRVLAALRAAGPATGLTADEAATRLGESVLSVRPRFTELLKLGQIVDTGMRRRNESGRSAKVWRVT